MKHFLLSLVLFAATALACDGGFRKDSIQIPPHSALANGMTEKDFRETLKAFEKFFGPQIEDEYRAELMVIGSWASNTVNAYAERKEDAWIISLNGGLARHKDMTLDGLKLVLCHELGHHLGGYPKKSSNKWSSAEGQADYYATMKCLRRFWEKEENQTALGGVNIPEQVVKECAASYETKKEQALCVRMNLAGKSLALMIQDLDQDSIEPKFETPDPLVVRAINFMHPFAQCRLDTFFAGSICQASPKSDFDDEDETVGACHERRNDTRGLRPRCWFVPMR